MNAIDAIVMGGSAGALDALVTILSNIDAHVTCPILVVIHLSPERPSVLPNILSRICSRAVVAAANKMTPARNSIVVAPANYHLVVERDRTVSLSTDALVNYSRPAIDVLFESAADVFGSGLVGVVMSGANEDGAKGIRRVRDAGGVAIVQDPITASSARMPKAAIRELGSFASVFSPVEIGTTLFNLLGDTTHPAKRPA